MMAGRTQNVRIDEGDIGRARLLAVLLAGLSVLVGIAAQASYWRSTSLILTATMTLLAARVAFGISRWSMTIRPLFLGLEEFGYSVLFMLGLVLEFQLLGVFVP